MSGYADCLGFREENQKNQRGDKAHGRQANRIPQAGIDIAGGGYDGECGCREEATEPAVADVVGSNITEALAHTRATSFSNKHRQQRRKSALGVPC
jgi:hypothetical protein